MLLNAAAALVAADLAEDIPEGLRLAARVIDEGAARDRMEKFVTSSRNSSVTA